MAMTDKKPNNDKNSATSGSETRDDKAPKSDQVSGPVKSDVASAGQQNDKPSKAAAKSGTSADVSAADKVKASRPTDPAAAQPAGKSSDKSGDAPDGKSEDKAGSTQGGKSEVKAASTQAVGKADSTQVGKAGAKPADQPAKPTGPGAAEAGGGPGGGGPDGPRPPATGSDTSSDKPSSVPLIVLAVGVLGLAGALWWQHTTSTQHIAQLETLVRESQNQANEARQNASQAMDALNSQRDAIAALRSELRDAQAELSELGSAFQTITDRGSDLVLLNDIDHLVMIAQQQLRLNGNVANAIISLETAQAQLARANRPALASLQQTINGDLDRLRATTTVDIARLSSRLDELAGLILQAPLVVPDGASTLKDKPAGQSGATSPSAPESRTVPDDAQWWERALAQGQDWFSQGMSSLRNEFGELVSVRRVDDSAALLISADQATRLRDSLRQRIMTAQLALMMDQAQIWETETDAIAHAVETRFDARSPLSRQALRIAREVADTRIDTPLPDVSNSIQALEALNEQMGRHSLPAQMETGSESMAVTEPESTTESSSESAPESSPESAPESAPESEMQSGAAGAADAGAKQE